MTRIAAFILFIILGINETNSQNWVDLNNGLCEFCLPFYYVDTETNELYIYKNIRSDHYGDTLNGIGKWNGDRFVPLGTGGPLNPIVYSVIHYLDTLFLSTWMYWDPYQPEPVYKYWSKYNKEKSKLDTLNVGPIDNVTFALKQINGLLYASGIFTKCGNENTWGFCTYDGKEWKSIFNYSREVGNSEGWDEFLWYKDKLYVGGNFYLTDAYGNHIEDIAILENGQLYPFGGVINFTDEGFVSTLTIFQDELYIGGLFLTANGMPVNHIVRWNGTEFKDVGGGLDYWVSDMIVYNGSLYVSGAFNFTGDGTYAPNIARWDGENWHAFTTDIFDGSPIVDLEIYNDELYISGGFFTINGDTFNHVAKYNHQLPGEEDQLEVWYNTYQQSIIISYEQTVKYDIKMDIYDISGKLLQHYTYESQTGYLQQSIPVDGLSAGVYLVYVQAGGKKLFKKILKPE